MSETKRTPDELASVDYRPAREDWLGTGANFAKGTYCYSALSKNQKYLDLPDRGNWLPSDEKWPLPDNWKQIILDGMADRLKRFRSLSVCSARS